MSELKKKINDILIMFEEGEITPYDMVAKIKELVAINKGDQEKMFDTFWSIYPKKIGKKQCIEYWKRVKISVSLHETIMDALRRQIAHKKCMDERQEWCPEFPHPIRWLKNCRWEDEIIEPRGNFREVYRTPKYNSRDER